MSHSSSLWMTPRNGDVNCEACTDRPPCMNHDLTFGANLDNYSRALNVSRIAITEIISFTNNNITPPTTTETPLAQTTATEALTTIIIANEIQTTATTNTPPPETTATEVPNDQLLMLIIEEESRLQDKV